MAKRKSMIKKTRRRKTPVDPRANSSALTKESSPITNQVYRDGASGSYSNSAIAMIPPGQPFPTSKQEQTLGVKIARAMLSGPRNITRDATVAEMDRDGNLVILRRGTNNWICFPGDENQIGKPPMCADPMGLQWFMDCIDKKPQPTNRAPGIIYMLCGATQHSNTDPFDRTSPAIPIGPHWMIVWPFNAKQSGLPNTIRDAGAWVMYDGTPYAYLHICGSPWIGNVYNEGMDPIWTMAYGTVQD
ncbi:hypothetical protein [Paenibacillus sp. BC26]|uniref:hypothetical protein n=1 Tax=Paenibacillus sp. BC26 TaxID=1881032 RepID=UPI0008EB4FC4|nr:hypothetical protein [Paenibacillus sp. BC26]SFS68379.1 hypothetical protein SAMN05428962_2180 [Paenibacillus sp. BC26]